MTFQDCLIKWLLDKSDFHIQLLSAAKGLGSADCHWSSPSGSGQSPATRTGFGEHGSKCGNNLVDFPGLSRTIMCLENLNFKFHDFQDLYAPWTMHEYHKNQLTSGLEKPRFLGEKVFRF